MKKYLRYMKYSIYPIGFVTFISACIYGMIACFKSATVSAGMNAVGDFIVGVVMLCGAVTSLTVLGAYWSRIAEEREKDES